MKKQQENPVVTQDSNSSWHVRTSMLAMLAAATPAAAHAGTAASDVAPVAPAIAMSAARPVIIFVPGTGLPTQPSTSVVAIAATTAIAPLAPFTATSTADTNIAFLRGTGLPAATSASPVATTPASASAPMDVFAPARNDAASVAPMTQLEQPQSVAAVDYATASIVADEAPTYGNRAADSASDHALSMADGFDIKFRADTLVVTPVLNVGLVESERTAAAGETVSFMGYSNYPAFIEKAEVRIFRATQSPDSEPVEVLAVDGNGLAQWTVPGNAPSAMFYTYRVYDRGARFDETAPQELTIVEQALAQKKASERVSRPQLWLGRRSGSPQHRTERFDGHSNRQGRPG